MHREGARPVAIQQRIGEPDMSLTSLLPSWELALDSANKSPKTIKSYTASVRALSRYLRANDMPDGPDETGTEHIRAFLVAERERTTPAYSQQHYRNLSVFFHWLAGEGEMTGPNPMDRGVKP